MEGTSTAATLHGRHVAIIAICCLTCGIPAAMILSTAGLFYPVIASDLGVPTAEISAWMSVSMLMSAFLSPLVGNLIARYNVRKFMVLGVLAAGLAFYLFSVSTEPWMFWVAGGITGFTLVTCLSLIPTVLVNRWFGKHVGLIIGLCTSFTGIGGVVFLMVGQGIIDECGWRAAYLAFAVIAVAVCTPMVFVCVREWPSDCGLAPYGAGEPAAAPGEGTAAIPAGGTVPAPAGEPPAGPFRRSLVPSPAASYGGARARARSQMRTAPFWLLIACGFCMNMVSQVNGYFPLYVDWLGQQAAYGMAAGAFTTGSMLLALSQVGNAVGKVGLGAAIDLSPSRALALLAACGALGTAFVWLAPATPLMAAGGLVFGFFIAGGIVLLPMLVRAVFGGGAEYPLLLSRVNAAPTVGSALGNVLFPYLAEGPWGFDGMFALSLACIAVVLATSLAALALRRA